MNEENKVDHPSDPKEQERLINKPAKFQIGDTWVSVEAHPPGAVTCIVKHIISKAKRIDLEILREFYSQKHQKQTKPKTKDLDTGSIYDLLSAKIDEDSQEDYKLYQMILTPTVTWQKRRGNLQESDYPITVDELEWNSTENLLLDIFMEWTARNPRFERQKKTLELASKT